jgi:diaminopimelate decarboxylase
VDLHELATSHGTPLHVIDGRRIDAAADAAMAPFRRGTGADIFYSYKTNPVPGLLARLHHRGIGAEVISDFELWLAFEQGVPPQRIIFNGPAKSDESLRAAIAQRIWLINANSSSEIERIAALAEEERTVVRIGLRVALPGMWGGQFGIASDSSQVEDATRRALSHPYLDLVALHFHRGGTMRTAADWRAHVAAVAGYCDEFARRTGWTPAVVDLGGSLACPTAAIIPERQFRLNRAFGSDLLPPDPDQAISLATASEEATAMLHRHFHTSGRALPRVVMEPGRALTGDTQILLASVVDLKDDAEPVHAILDAGMNIADPLPHEYHQLFSVSAPSAPGRTNYRLVGPICTPADVLYYNWRLPALDVGDVLAIMDAGAYFVPFSTTFSFPRPPILMVDDVRVDSCRRRETFSDLVSMDVDEVTGVRRLGPA